MAYEMTWAPRGLLATYRGETSDKEVTELARRGQADERFGELHYVLHDFTAGVSGILCKAGIGFCSAEWLLRPNCCRTQRRP